IDDETGRVTESFQLRPFAQNNPQMGGLIGTPATKHYLTHDIYTLITAAMSEPHQQTEQGEQSGFEAYDEPAIYETNIGDTLRYRNGYIVVEGINRDATVENIPRQDDDIIVGLKLNIHAVSGEASNVDPELAIRGGTTFDACEDVEEQGLGLRFSNIMPQKDKLELMVDQKALPEKKGLVLSAIRCPYIN